MKAIPLISLGLSLALGAGAIFFGREFMSGDGGEANAAVAAPAIAMTQIAVARATIEPGKLIDASMVEMRDWPESAVPAGAMRAVTDLGETAYSRGLVVAGEPLLAEKIDTTGSVLTLAANIQPGMRAVSVVVANDTGVAGFVLPGDRVDVNEFVEAKDARGAPEDSRRSADVFAQPVLKGVKVLAVDQTFEEGLEGAYPSNTVTLEVTPQDALLLGAASRRAALGLALIGREEELAEIIAVPKVAPPKRPQTRPARTVRAPTTATVRVIHGSEDAQVSTPVAPPAAPVKLTEGAS
ncbi:putative Flp pilus assembly protein CpaB [Hyphomonas neptunium ATCC 15444]|uniref:Putative Flp pilus assembly protein CpaB n=2 Tax=Hyphomonas TaxID=85 RepID=Q0C325_HYPNA|nr:MULTISPECIES: Flp pilus assembly protein CpaB [Hyphomonas]ABI75396.1 putative Flp pilus assembly protein CpaB [Hyphomonas neptunium ATCC 15444]KCZ95895.1 putative Flp pilus assembly protein CpaB [Hyphomonas hirschiana VP5]